MEARCARGCTPSAPRRRRVAANAARPRLCRHVSSHELPASLSASAKPRAGGRRSDFAAPRSAGRRVSARAARASTSDSPHLSERSERSSRSELCGGPCGRAPQGSRDRQGPTAAIGAAAGHPPAASRARLPLEATIVAGFAQRAGDTRQTLPPTSSATSSAPCLSTATPTGRPYASPPSLRKPVSTSTGGPEGLPLASNGT